VNAFWIKVHKFQLPDANYYFELPIVTSAWHYSQDSRLKMQDKDFKRLNKSALGNRATTAHVSYIYHMTKVQTVKGDLEIDSYSIQMAESETQVFTT